MKRLLIRDIVLDNTPIDKLHLYLDDTDSIILLPTLWALHIANTYAIYGWLTKGVFTRSGMVYSKAQSVEKYFESREISDNTHDNYAGHFYKFLCFLNDLHKEQGTPGVHNTELVSSQLINHYLNSVLPEQLRSSASLKSHQSALMAYFNFLFAMEIKETLTTTIYRKTRQRMAELDDRPFKTSYLSLADRNDLLMACYNQRDRLILRMGFEAGLRASENTGLVLEDHKAKNMNRPGLLQLFEELESFPSKYSFEFILSGKYTKGGRSRPIYFDRELLSAIKQYHDTERKQVLNESGKTCKTLFVRFDKEGKGEPVSPALASQVFSDVRSRCPHINKALSYHDLRHTFATELYHAELLDSEGRETRSESAALIVVAERLGHRNAASSTPRYIRLRQQMISIEQL